MKELTDRIEALAARSAKDKAKEAAQAENDRKAAWHQIQTEEPELAEMMTMLGDAFGKPKSVKVTLKGKVIVDVGKFDPVRPGLDYGR